MCIFFLKMFWNPSLVGYERVLISDLEEIEDADIKLREG